MVHILSSDLLIADVITPLAGNDALQNLVRKYGLKPGGKSALSRGQFEEFSAVIEGKPITIVPGGSSANMLTTLSKLLGKDITVTFLGVVGKSMYSSMIRQSLAEAHITLLPEISAGTSTEAAVSYIILLENGQRTSATYPGNAQTILKPELISDTLVKQSDVVFVQGSLWRKMEWVFADRLIERAMAHHKALWLTLPTHTNFSEGKPGLFPGLLKQADVVLSNEEELLHIYHADFDGALRQLQKEFEKKQVAFVTRAEKGAAIIKKEEILLIPPIARPSVVNTLGAGDTAFAGFAAGYLQHIPLEQCGHIAMVLAGEKLTFNNSRLPDPKATLEKVSPNLAALLK